jgi:hypothetical protein
MSNFQNDRNIVLDHVDLEPGIPSSQSRFEQLRTVKVSRVYDDAAFSMT